MASDKCHDLDYASDLDSCKQKEMEKFRQNPVSEETATSPESVYQPDVIVTPSPPFEPWEKPENDFDLYPGVELGHELCAFIGIYPADRPLNSSSRV